MSARAQTYLDTQHDVKLVLQQRRTPFRSKRSVCCPFVCEERDEEACLYRCTKWKPQHGLSNGTVEQLCLVTFRLTNLSQPKERAAEQQQEFVPMGVRNAGMH